LYEFRPSRSNFGIKQAELRRSGEGILLVRFVTVKRENFTKKILLFSKKLNVKEASAATDGSESKLKLSPTNFIPQQQLW
jgi:hypothetical protein